jgi:hypothetical protein
MTDVLTLFGTYIAIIITLAVYSYIIKETDLFRFAEYSFLATSIGWAILLGLDTINNVGVSAISKGRYDYIIPIILGLLLFTRFSGKLWYLARYPVAFILGVGLGVFMRGQIHAMFLQQIAATVITPVTVDSLIILVGVLSVLVFFYFTREHKGALGYVSTLGRYFLMVGFGATFGNTVLYRINLAVGRIIFILRALGLLP